MSEDPAGTNFDPVNATSNGDESIVAGNTNASIARPRKNGASDAPDASIFDPASIVNAPLDGGNADSGDKPTPGKRGRKPGSGTKGTTRAPSPLSVSTFATIFLLGSSQIAKASGIPEVQLSEKESQQLGLLSANVERHFDIMPESPLIQDVLTLVTSLGMIAYSHLLAYKQRTKGNDDV